MRTLCILLSMLFIPVASFASPRVDINVSSRTGGDSITSDDGDYSLSDAYSDVMVIVRALVAPRSNNQSQQTTRTSPRGNATNVVSNTAVSVQESTVTNKQQYINFLKNGSTGGRNDCADKYKTYNSYFRTDSSQSGQITVKPTGPNVGRMDLVCDFMDYGHWCFALGFAYGVRDFNNNDRTRLGYKCFTYQEYCISKNKSLDNSKIDGYISKIIDEISFYNSNIKNTANNSVMVTTEKKSGGSSITTDVKWKTYDTDVWVNERIPQSEMTRLLCI